jgi:hypothetical protein
MEQRKFDLRERRKKRSTFETGSNEYFRNIVSKADIFKQSTNTATSSELACTYDFTVLFSFDIFFLLASRFLLLPSIFPLYFVFTPMEECINLLARAVNEKAVYAENIKKQKHFFPRRV